VSAACLKADALTRRDAQHADGVRSPRRATSSTTLGAYSHAIPSTPEEAAALIAGLVFAAGGQEAQTVHGSTLRRSFEG
jgi:hypothetical protein